MKTTFNGPVQVAIEGIAAPTVWPSVAHAITALRGAVSTLTIWGPSYGATQEVLSQHQAATISAILAETGHWEAPLILSPHVREYTMVIRPASETPT
jgi:hypothetical protein